MLQVGYNQVYQFKSQSLNSWYVLEKIMPKKDEFRKFEFEDIINVLPTFYLGVIAFITIISII